MTWDGGLDLTTLRAAYAGGLSPREVVADIHDRIAARGDDATWIHLVPRADALAQAAALERDGDRSRPLYGVPVSIKDCNDVPGLPTTNGFPPMRYVAPRTGQAIARLLDAGAIVIGKTNMDQFGIGLSGMRSPYGAPGCIADPAYISGGSSSGSAISVAAGLVSASIANDAAGSGRVPAALNGIVGLKPTPGLVSNTCVSGGGVLKTLETLAVFAGGVDDAAAVLRVIAGYDPDDPFSRIEADRVDVRVGPKPAAFTFGVFDRLEFFGDAEAATLFDAARARLARLGGQEVTVPAAPFAEARAMLYDGPWIAERALALDPVVAGRLDAVHPVTSEILRVSDRFSARDVFRAMHRLAELKLAVRRIWQRIDVLVVPSTPTTYTKAAMAADPIRLNTRLGHYTNFVNLLDLCAIAVPNGCRADGLPQGLTLLAPAWQEALILSLATAHEAMLAPAVRPPGRPLAAPGRS